MGVMEEADLRKYTVPELQQECKRRGLKKGGVKAKLIQRLSEYIEKNGPEYPDLSAATEDSTRIVHQTSDKKVRHAIVEPHPYMEEYEDSLIEGADREVESNDEDFFTSRGKREVLADEDVVEEDFQTPDSDVPI